MLLNKSRLTEKIKRALALTLCLSFGLAAAAVFSTKPAFASSKNNSGYIWHRIYSQTQLQEIVNGGSNGVLNDSPKRDLDDIRSNGWVRFMLIYDNTYFTSKSNGDENWEGRRILSSYDIKAGADTFTTRSGLDTPYIKYTGSGSNYYVRFCEEGTDFLSKDFLSFQTSWYGIAEASACYGEFVLGPAARVDDTNYGKGKASWSCSKTRQHSVQVHFAAHWTDCFTGGITQKQANALMAAYDYTVKEWRAAPGGGIYSVNVHPSSEKKIEWVRKNCTDPEQYDLEIFNKVIKNDLYPAGITDVEAYNKVYKPMCEKYSKGDHDAAEGMAWFGYDVPGAFDRYWQIDGSEIATGQGDKGSFMVYWGEPYDTPSYGDGDFGQYDLPPGTTVFENFETIEQNYSLYVHEGSTLIISGHIINNGIIQVDGGTLLVRGCLDSDVGTNNWFDGSINVTHGGTVIVEKDGCILTRRGESALFLSSESSFVAYGAANFTWLDIEFGSTVRVAPGGLLAVYVKANDTIEYKNLVSGALKKYKDYSLGSFFTSYSTVPHCGIKQGCSLVAQGAFIAPYCKDENGGSAVIYCDEMSYMNIWRETDLNRTIDQAMPHW